MNLDDDPIRLAYSPNALDRARWRRGRREASDAVRALTAQAMNALFAAQGGDLESIYTADLAVSRAVRLVMAWRLDLGDAA